MPGILRHRPPSRRAAALVEMAIVLPLLVFIVVGCVDFGRFAYVYITVTNAARTGAFVGAMTPTAQSSWQQKVQNAISGEMHGMAGFQQSKLLVPTPTVVTESNGEKRVRVRVEYTFDMILPWPKLLGTSSKPQSEKVLFRDVEMRSIRPIR